MRTKPRFRSLAPFMLFALTTSAAIGVGVAHPRHPRPRREDDSAQKFNEGEKLFRARCGYCHLAGGTGTIMLGRRLGKDHALLDQRTDLTAAYVKTITRVGLNSMPPHTRIEVPDTELDLIAAFIARPASAHTPPASPPSTRATHE
ncbi:MAG: cytochrome c [Candidatus Acidoferrales bacterium]|nr:cytochrome c [Candidatus Acidoferrales bacterium]